MSHVFYNCIGVSNRLPVQLASCLWTNLLFLDVMNEKMCGACPCVSPSADTPPPKKKTPPHPPKKNQKTCVPCLWVKSSTWSMCNVYVWSAWMYACVRINSITDWKSKTWARCGYVKYHLWIIKPMMFCLETKLSHSHQLLILNPTLKYNKTVNQL